MISPSFFRVVSRYAWLIQFKRPFAFRNWVLFLINVMHFLPVPSLCGCICTWLARSLVSRIKRMRTQPFFFVSSLGFGFCFAMLFSERLLFLAMDSLREMECLFYRLPYLEVSPSSEFFFLRHFWNRACLKSSCNFVVKNTTRTVAEGDVRLLSERHRDISSTWT